MLQNFISRNIAEGHEDDIDYNEIYNKQLSLFDNQAIAIRGAHHISVILIIFSISFDKVLKEIRT